MGGSGGRPSVRGFLVRCLEETPSPRAQTKIPNASEMLDRAQ